MQLVFEGQPFDAAAVLHTLRHLAMRVGWRFVRESPHRIVYLVAGAEAAGARDLASGSVVVRSGPEVARHLQESREPIPLLAGEDGTPLPFPKTPSKRPGWVDADVIAGAHACLNLWYEQRTRASTQDGWIVYDDDWMARAGLCDPLPLADRWLDQVYAAAIEAGWPATRPQRRCTVVLTHDVDYLPTRMNLGLPRLARAVYRQCVLRRRPADAIRILRRYVGALVAGRRPYDEIECIVAEERKRKATSSFQLVVARRYGADPAYGGGDLAGTTIPPGWEVCLHGSYGAARTPGLVKVERQRLETLLGQSVTGYRQHYLNFEPSCLFSEVADAGLCYDMSVGYNDRSGPRAGTYFPYRPYDLENGKPYGIWEVPFVLMDTTLATTYRFAPRQAVEHGWSVLKPVISTGGCVSVIWHQEQCGGLLDPGYDQVYLDIMDGLVAAGAVLTTGAALLLEWEAAWNATVSADLALPAGL